MNEGKGINSIPLLFALSLFTDSGRPAVYVPATLFITETDERPFLLFSEILREIKISVKSVRE